MIELFRVDATCRACHHDWLGYAHGFARGHLVFERAERCIFVADDIWYGFPEGTTFDIAALLEPAGWHRLELCPSCFSPNIKLPDLAASLRVKLPCEDLEPDDFEPGGNGWRLSASGSSKVK